MKKGICSREGIRKYAWGLEPLLDIINLLTFSLIDLNKEVFFGTQNELEDIVLVVGCLFIVQVYHCNSIV